MTKDKETVETSCNFLGKDQSDGSIAALLSSFIFETVILLHI